MLLRRAPTSATSSQMRGGVRARARRASAPIHGVIHGAGIVGGGTFRPLTELGRRSARSSSTPRWRASLALDAGPRTSRELDFCMLTSSLSSVLGGFGYGAYAAANLYMDALRARAHRRGAALDQRQLGRVAARWRRRRGRPDAGLARFAMGPPRAPAPSPAFGLPACPQVAVSTGDLASRIDQWIAPRGAARGRRGGGGASRPPRPPHLHNAYVAPARPPRRRSRAIWAELLGLEKVGIHDNFFELGGHSLLAIQVVTRLKAELGPRSRWPPSSRGRPSSR